MPERIAIQARPVGPSAEVEYKRTSWLYECGRSGLARIFLSDDGETVAVQEEFVKALNLSTLYGSGPNDALTTARQDGKVVVMPYMLHSTELNVGIQWKAAPGREERIQRAASALAETR